jgi:uncharacterized membrane protein (UPF0127 family)
LARHRGTLTLRRQDGRVVCEAVEVRDTTFRRLRGLLGRRNLPPDQGVVLRPAWSIHTAFMRFPIDVVFLDHDQVVIRIDPELRPFKTASCRGAREIVELAAGECARRGLELGDRVAWAGRAAADEGVSADDALAPAPARRGPVVVASPDQRFVKLVRFLLDGRGIEVTATVPVDAVGRAVEEERPIAVVLDAGDELGDALRSANALRAARPEVHLVLAGEGAAERTPTGVRVYDKWDETEALVDAVDAAVSAEDEAPYSPLTPGPEEGPAEDDAGIATPAADSP